MAGSWVNWLSRTGQQTLRRQKIVYLRKKTDFEKGQFLHKNKGESEKMGFTTRKKLAILVTFLTNLFGKNSRFSVNACLNPKSSITINIFGKLKYDGSFVNLKSQN